jgi:hypothetical protein
MDAGRVDLAPRPELYNLDAVAYESVMLGLFCMWRGQPGPLAADHLPGMMRHDLKDLASTGLPVIKYHCLALDHELPHNGK